MDLRLAIGIFQLIACMSLGWMIGSIAFRADSKWQSLILAVLSALGVAWICDAIRKYFGLM